MTDQPSKRRAMTRPAARAVRPPIRAGATPAASQAQIKEIEERLVKLELLLETVRSEATKSTGAARLRLERIEKLVTTRIASTRATLKASLDRMGQALVDSKKSVEQALVDSKKSVERMGQAIVDSKKNVEREVGLLTRGLKAGVRATRDAYRGKRDT